MEPPMGEPYGRPLGGLSRAEGRIEGDLEKAYPDWEQNRFEAFDPTDGPKPTPYEVTSELKGIEKDIAGGAKIGDVMDQLSSLEQRGYTEEVGRLIDILMGKKKPDQWLFDDIPF